MYFVENGKLMYQDDHYRLCIEKPAFMYDTEDNLLLKHGEYERVLEYFNTYVASMSRISPELATKVRLFALAVPLDKAAAFLNETISCTGAVKEQIDRILGGLK